MNEYRTSDIVLAASLKIHKYEMIRIDVEGSKGIFVFKDVDKEFLTDFDMGRVTVEPVAFNHSIRQLTTSVRRLIS